MIMKYYMLRDGGRKQVFPTTTPQETAASQMHIVLDGFAMLSGP